MDHILQLTEYAAGYQFPDPTAYSVIGVRGKGMVRKRSHSGTISGRNRVFLDPFETSDPPPRTPMTEYAAGFGILEGPHFQTFAQRWASAPSMAREGEFWGGTGDRQVDSKA